MTPSSSVGTLPQSALVTAIAANISPSYANDLLLGANRTRNGAPHARGHGNGLLDAILWILAKIGVKPRDNSC